MSTCLGNMEKLDLKDRKILYELDLDSRQSFRSIGRKVGLSKDIVATRVKKLDENGVITGYCVIVDYSKLGYNLYRFYFSFQNVTPQLKKEIIDYFKNEKIADTVCSLEGSYDMMVAVYVKNFPEAQTFWHKTLKKYGKYFSKKVFSAFCQEDYYGYRFLLEENDNKKSMIHQAYDSGLRVELNDLDYKIIDLISQNSRLPTTEIAKSLDTTSTVIQNRLKKLMEKDIIIGYRINVDLPKLEYYIYKVDIELNQFDELGKITEYAVANPYLIEVCKTIGYVDLELCFVCKNSFELHQIIEDISNKFPASIKNYKYFVDIKTHKTYGI